MGNRYFQNPAYKYDANVDLMNECFVNAFEASGLGDDPEYFEYLKPILKGNNQLGHMLHMVKGFQSSLKKYNIRPNNTNFRRRFNQTFPKPPIRHNVFTRALQTTRRLEGKLNEGTFLTPEQQTALNNARETITQYELENPNTRGGRRYQKTKRQKKHH